MLVNVLFGAVKLTKDADLGKYKYHGHCAGFDPRGSLSLSYSSGFDKNMIIYGADLSLSVHTDNNKKTCRALNSNLLVNDVE